MKYISLYILIVMSLSCKLENKKDSSYSKLNAELKSELMSKTIPSKKLKSLVLKGLDHGVLSIKDGDGPLIPFVMEQKNGQIKLTRFLEDTLEEGLEQAKQYLIELEESPDLAIIVYDGLLTIQGTKHDAFMVNGYERNYPKGFCFAQQYKPKDKLSPFKEIGNPFIINLLENILEE